MKPVIVMVGVGGGGLGRKKPAVAPRCCVVVTEMMKSDGGIMEERMEEWGRRKGLGRRRGRRQC